MDRPTYSSEETLLLVETLSRRISEVERLAMDHEQRFDTLQTWFWKRILFWLWGWPWHDLNAEGPKRRPWHRFGIFRDPMRPV